MGARFSRRRGTCARFFRRARRQIQQTRVATTEAILTPANSVTRTETQCETNAAGTGHAQQQVSAPEQTRVASISEACPTPANVTRTETDAAGTGQLQRSKSRTGDGLTLVKLKTMKGADGKPLNLIQKIAAGDYTTFGMLLLQDDNGEEVTVIKRDHIHDGAVSVTQAILVKWLTSGAAPTRTYQHLIECIRQSELGTLADNVIAAEMAGYLMATPETPQTTQQRNPHIASYANYLREVYKSRSQSHTSQHWSHLPQCEFIQLAMIEGGKLRRGGPEEEMVRLAQQGRIETIMSHKTTIDLNSLLVTEQPLVILPPPTPPREVLIEGAPGGGKSTLAFYICHQWAQGAYFLSRFDVVVIAYLREQAIQNASTLADILPADSIEMSQMVATQMKHSHGHNVLFIFDGWDELPCHLQDDSLVSTIIRKPEKLSLHRSTVLITSRPVSSGNLFVNRRVEILGFTQHQIRKYIEKALDGNSTHVQKLVQHLKDHPVIEGYCYIPLHAAILVHVFLTKNGVLPTTRHQLFSNFILCCLVRELETHDSKQTAPELSSLDNLPTDLQIKLRYLCVLAYEGVIRDKVVFYQEDLEALHLPASLPSLGLLQAVEGFTLISKSHSYNFLHLSVQELLAAYHISLMSPNEQQGIFQNLVESPRFQSVLHYYSGCTKLENQGIQGFIFSYTRQKSDFDSILPLLHCFFEAQQRSLCPLVEDKFRSIKLDEFMNPVDFLAIGYFVTSVTSSAAAYLEIDSINDNQVKLLLSELPVLKYLVKVLLEAGVVINEVSEQRLPYDATSFPGQPPLDIELLVKVGGFQKVCLTSHCLTGLEFQNINLECTKEGGNALIEMLQWNKFLTHLDLSKNNTFSDFGACCIFHGLQHSTTLSHLNLSKTGLTDRGATYIAQILDSNCPLQWLDISYNRIGSDGFATIAKSLMSSAIALNQLYISFTATNATAKVEAIHAEREENRLQPINVTLIGFSSE